MLSILRALMWMYVGALVFAAADAALPVGEAGNFIREYQDLIGSSIGAATVLLLVVQMQKDRARHQGMVGLTLRTEQKALAGAYRYASTVLEYDLDQDMRRLSAILNFHAIPVIPPLSAKVQNDLNAHAQDHILQIAEKLSRDVETINGILRATTMSWGTRIEGIRLGVGFAKTTARSLQEAIKQEAAFMDTYANE